MNSSGKANFRFGRGVGISEAEDLITKILHYVVSEFESENYETSVAYEEANKFVFAYEHQSLGGTIAQWIAHGGSEARAREVIKSFINENYHSRRKKVER